MKYDLDQLQDQDQDHFSSLIKLKATCFIIWFCFNQSFMHFKGMIEMTMTNKGTLVPIWIEKKIVSLTSLSWILFF